jgi:putative ABC transport system permease protein
MLMRLYRQRFAVLRALGASRTYVLAVAWTFSFGLIAVGSLLGLVVAAAFVGVVSSMFSQASGIAMSASIGWTEIWLALALAAIGAVLAVLPAALLYRRPVVEALRSA